MHCEQVLTQESQTLRSWLRERTSLCSSVSGRMFMKNESLSSAVYKPNPTYEAILSLSFLLSLFSNNHSWINRVYTGSAQENDVSSIRVHQRSPNCQRSLWFVSNCCYPVRQYHDVCPTPNTTQLFPSLCPFFRHALVLSFLTDVTTRHKTLRNGYHCLTTFTHYLPHIISKHHSLTNTFTD